MATVGLPLTGAGDATAQVATDLIGGAHYQRMKLMDGLEGSTLSVLAKETTPGTTDAGLVVRNIPSSGQVQLIAGTVTVSNPTSQVDVANQPTVNLSSLGSTRVVGTVNVSSGVILAAGSSTNTLGAVVLASGNTAAVVGAVAVSSGVVLGAGSSGNILGSVVNAPATSANLIGAVAVSSGVILAAGSSGNILGSVVNAPATSANLIGSVAVSSGVILAGGSSGNTLGSVALVAGSSANVVGAAAQGPASSANYWHMNSVPFSSGTVTRSSVATSVDVSVVAANASRKALVIANLSTSQVIALGLTTAAMTTGLANVSMYLQPAAQVTFGGGGNFPLYLGPIRGIDITSTGLGGGVAVTEFA